MAAKTQRIGLFPEEIRFRGAVRAVALGAETGAYRAVDPEAVPSRRFRGFRFVAADTQLAQRGDQFPGDDPGFCDGAGGLRLFCKPPESPGFRDLMAEITGARGVRSVGEAGRLDDRPSLRSLLLLRRLFSRLLLLFRRFSPVVE